MEFNNYSDGDGDGDGDREFNRRYPSSPPSDQEQRRRRRRPLRRGLMQDFQDIDDDNDNAADYDEDDIVNRGNLLQQFNDDGGGGGGGGNNTSDDLDLAGQMPEFPPETARQQFERIQRQRALERRRLLAAAAAAAEQEEEDAAEEDETCFNSADPATRERISPGDDVVTLILPTFVSQRRLRGACYLRGTIEQLATTIETEDLVEEFGPNALQFYRLPYEGLIITAEAKNAIVNGGDGSRYYELYQVDRKQVGAHSRLEDIYSARPISPATLREFNDDDVATIVPAPRELTDATLERLGCRRNDATRLAGRRISTLTRGELATLVHFGVAGGPSACYLMPTLLRYIDGGARLWPHNDREITPAEIAAIRLRHQQSIL